jgi:BirA family transcriptional regulator, biotin operon repressor / biotin---[acetyl-CoA-carboxylase] ligase
MNRQREHIGRRVFWVDSIASTNSELLLKAEEYEHGDVLAAREQQAGRGRYGRQWQSREGGLYMSFLLKEIRNPRELLPLSLLMALSVVRVLKNRSQGEFAIKWPNDVYVNERKICGILPETRVCGKSVNGVVGIGINVNNEIPPAGELRNPAISLRELTGELCDLRLLAEEILDMGNLFYRDIRTGLFNTHLSDLNHYLYRRGQQLNMTMADGQRAQVTPLSFTEDAALRCLRDGKEVVLFLGE